MAFVLVQHLDPTHESMLTQLLSKASAMPIRQARDAVRLQPDHVYVIPPNTDMTVANGILHITPRKRSVQHLPIDHFLRSLAIDQPNRAIGAVLSGSGSDGTLGLTAIKAAGGITFAQDDSAKYRGMPRSAISAGCADFILSPAQMAKELGRIAGHPYVNGAEGSEVRLGDDVSVTDGLGKILRTLRSATGADFTGYRSPSVRRRVARRMLVQKIAGFDQYAEYLRNTPGEAQALYDDILIHVTHFFREPKMFAVLTQKVFPAMFKERGADEPIRVWSPGCSTGEEVYSIAIAMLEFLGDRDVPPIQLFGSDISETTVRKARAGRFTEVIAKDVSPERLRRFFTKIDGGYEIHKRIRDMCVFAQHNLLTDPPFSKVDVISCCNVLIYFSPALQQRIVPIFHYALNPTGVLVLGVAEGVGPFTDLFSAVDKKLKIYRKNPAAPSNARFGIAAPALAVPAKAAVSEKRLHGDRPIRPDSEKEADRFMLAKYAPAGVVINADGEILHFRGRTGSFLEASPGAANLNLFNMAREGLLFGLREAVGKVRKTSTRVRHEGLRVKSNGQTREVAIEVVPLSTGQLLVLFEDHSRIVPPSAVPAKQITLPAKQGRAAERGAVALERELNATKAHLRSIIEDREAANEELRAATEEIQSSNEELQSTNEELETATEELQATNEELTTVNDELQSRNVELTQTANDLANVLSSIEIPIVMVGTDMRIRRVTRTVEGPLTVQAGDVGRPIGDLARSGTVEDLEPMLRDVLETLSPREREVRGRNGRWYSLRVRPYRTSDNKIDGVVMSLMDIETMKRALEHVTAARDQAEAVIETVREPLVLLDAQLRVLNANQAFYATFQVEAAETEGQLIYELGNGQWDIAALRTLLQEILPRESMVENFEVRHTFPTIGERTMLLNARHVEQPAATSLVLLAIEDVTGRRRAEAERAEMVEQVRTLLMTAEAANRSKDEFVAVVSHELRTPLTALLGWTRILQTGRLDESATVRAVDVIARNAKLQARLVEDLLDVSSMVTGRLRLALRPMEALLPVQDAVAVMKPVTDAKGVRLVSRLDATAGAIIGDPARIQQIVGNLLSNAIKFTDAGGEVTVRLERRDSVVRISVSDTGRGIEPEELPRLFTPFGQRDAHARGREAAGLGLGLTIVRHLTELHGGSVKAESVGRGHGASFTVDLPLTDRGVDKTAVAPTPNATTTALPSLDGIHVLVVEDEEDSRDFLAAALEGCGARVTAVASAKAALETLQREGADVLASDISMPEQTGYDLIREVRKLAVSRGGRIPAMALTAHARAEDRERAIEAGFQMHFPKPIDQLALAAAVLTLFELKTYRD
jgi:two-component system, chemotaxis family, CheB/CheR fusion protein